MKTAVERLPKSTIKLSVTVPKSNVKQAYDAILENVIKETEIQGFRKGKAPKARVEEQTDVSKLYGDVVNELLKNYYPQALKEHHINPISNPKVEIKEFDLEKDFEFEAIIAVKPTFEIGDYKMAVKETYQKKVDKSKKQNAEKLKRGDKIEDTHVHLTVDELLDAILETTQVELSDMLVEQEVDRMLTRLVDQAQAVGLSLDQYLLSQKKSVDQLRDDYRQIAVRSLQAEFVLGELIIKEKIDVSEDEVQGAINASGDETLRENMQSDSEKWYIKSILAKNKLISKISEEAEGHKHE